jgi:PAS domain-containing protein
MSSEETPTQPAGISGLNTTPRDLVDCIEDDLLVIDSEHRVRFANAAICGRFGKAVESVVGQLCYEVFHDRDTPCSPPLWDCPLERVLQNRCVSRTVHPTRIHGAVGAGRYFPPAFAYVSVNWPEPEGERH